MHHMNQYRIMASIHMPAARNNNEYIIGIVIACSDKHHHHIPHRITILISIIATCAHTLDKNGSLYDPSGTESCNMQIRLVT